MADQCPLCGGDNRCGALHSPIETRTCGAVSAPDEAHRCWCFRFAMPQELLAWVPEHLRGVSCICQGCVQAFIAAEAIGTEDA